MIVLGIETSCDETAASVLSQDSEVLSNIVYSQIKIHQEFGGVVPEIASRNHQRKILHVIDTALKKAGVTFKDLTHIAVTQGPGLIGALLVGLETAKALAYSLEKILVPVNHIHAHATAIFLSKGEKPDFPYLALVVSGGHTSLYVVEDFNKLEAVSFTVDDAAGEAFDKTAKLLGIPYPGGVHIEKIAKNGDPLRFKFPRPMMNKENFSFSGLKTAVRYFIMENLEKIKTDEQFKADVCASIQHTITDVLVFKTLNFARKLKIRDIVISGGVAANKNLRQKFLENSAKYNKKVFLTPFEYCTDNAAMVAHLGLKLAEKGEYPDDFLTLDSFSTLRKKSYPA